MEAKLQRYFKKNRPIDTFSFITLENQEERYNLAATLKKKEASMETMSYSPYQMKVIELMRHVQSEDQMKEISHLLSEYFA